MDREIRTIILPESQWKVEIVIAWTWGDFQEIQKVIMDNVDFATGEPEIRKKGTAQTEANKTAILLAVKKIIDKDGKEVAIEWENIKNLSIEDGQFLLNEVNKIDLSKKKV